MNTPFDLQSGNRQIVYVKTVDVTDLPKDVQDAAAGHDQLYAVHDSDGQRLALVADRKVAFALARQHDFAPVAVH